MDCFFNPRGIALVGATPDPAKGGFSILKNLTTGFKGKIYPVNPRYGVIERLKCYASVAEVPDPVDMAIVFVPAPKVLDVVRGCAECGIKGVMIQSAGFAEVGEAGRKLQHRLTEISTQTGIRIWGPNCMGLVDAVNRYVFSFVSPTIWEEGLLAGRLSLIVQSGMLSAGFLIDMMSHGTTGISKACSIGNKADVDECDILEYLVRDLDTSAIGLYLESVSDGRRFLRICRNSCKPIVALKGGRSPKGAVAAMSHTASLAGDDGVVSGAFAQCGVMEATDFNQMIDMGRSLSLYPGHRAGKEGGVAVLTFSGAAGIVSTDLMDEQGLCLADFSERTLDALKAVFPEWMPVGNPVDMWPAIERSGAERVYREAVQAVCADPGVNAVFLHIFVGGLARHVEIAPLVKLARDAEKPVFWWLLGRREEVKAVQKKANELGTPVYRELGRAVECIAAVLQYGRTQCGLFVS